MATYTYRCSTCGVATDMQQVFGEAPIEIHDMACGPDETGHRATFRRTFTAPAVTFRGPGFYRTDSRSTE